MRRSGILNAQLALAIASMGHGDTLMVVDAGFPVPADAWRIDLAVARDIPDLRTVLRLVADELIVEKIQYAEDVPTHNAPLAEWLAATWPAVETVTAPHSQMLTEVPRRARAIVRTGAFDPWGNIALTSGVDVAAFFARPGVVVPDYYETQMASSGEVSA